FPASRNRAPLFCGLGPAQTRAIRAAPADRAQPHLLRPMTSSAPVVTRFAPSPTGYLHIGGARTALFNYLYAKGRGGRFLLRIEDTDRERSTEAAVQAIFDGLAWLGLFADEPPVFQFSRVERHREVVQSLLDSGRAYRDFLTPEETEAEREKAHAAGHA